MRKTNKSNLERAQPFIQLVYRAAAEPRLWNDFVETLSEELGGPKIGLSLEFANAPNKRLSYVVGDASYASVFANFTARRSTPWPLEKLIDSKTFVNGNDLFPEEKLAETDFYREYMKPQGLMPVGAIGIVFGSEAGRPLAAMGIYRREGGRAIDAADYEVLNYIAPHLRQAYRIHCELVDSWRRRDAFAEVMDRFPIGVLLLNDDLMVVASNRAAQRILAAEDGFTLLGGVPRATDADSNHRFFELLSNGVHDRKEAGFSQVLSLQRRSGLRSYQVFVSRLLAAPDSGKSENAVGVVFVADPEDQHVGMPEMLSSLYNLTAAESELATLLCRGETVDDAAAIRGVSAHTARSQLKSVFSKTGVSRQADLVGLLLTSVTGLVDDAEPKGERADRPSGRRASTPHREVGSF